MHYRYLSIAILLFCTACGGRAANPVMVTQYGDDRKSCKAIEYELKSIEGEIQRLVPQTNKTGKNVALGVTGFFFIVPLFFMDLSHAEQEELNALRNRYNYLTSIAIDKNCGLEAKPIPEFTKPAEDESQKQNVGGELAPKRPGQR